DGACGDVQSRLDLYKHSLLHKGDDHGCGAARRPAGQLLRLQLMCAVYRQRT
ncbi:hypothetical protein M9458_006988, partial [Cirrhinus mrigala]